MSTVTSELLYLMKFPEKCDKEKKTSSANGPTETENPHTEKVMIHSYLPLHTKTNSNG